MLFAACEGLNHQVQAVISLKGAGEWMIYYPIERTRRSENEKEVAFCTGPVGVPADQLFGFY